MAKPSVHAMSRGDLRKATLRAFVPGEAAGAGRSSQSPADDPFTPNDAIPPPVNLDELAALTLLSPTRRSCIAAIVLNTVGRGFELTAAKGHEDELDPRTDLSELAERLDAFARRDERLGRPSFTRLLSAAIWDRNEVGQGFVEVSRNRTTGEVDGLYHVPGKRMRRKADGTGWIMGPRGGRGLELTHFYDFGRKVQYGDDGRPLPRLADGASRWDRNEVIVFRLYTSASRDYGLPPDAQLAIDYLGDKNAAQSNASFFDASAVPPTVIFVQGSESEDDQGQVVIEVDQTFVESITHTLKAGAGSRVAVVPVPPGTDTTKHELAVLSPRDMGFVEFRADNRRRTLGAFRLSPIFVADIEDTNYSTATIERKLTKDQLFDPEQDEIEDVLGQSLIRELDPAIAIDFAELDVTDDEARRQSANDLADRGKITNGEYRAAHGYPPMPEADDGADEDELEPGTVPHGWNDELVDPQDKARTLNPLAVAPPGVPEPDLGDDPEALAKSARRREQQLAGELEDDFEAAIAEGVRTVSLMADDAELRPVVIEKQDDGRVLVRPADPDALHVAGA